MSSQRETVRRPKGGGGVCIIAYLGIAILVASPVCLFLRPLISRLEDVYICTYVDMYS